MQNNNYIAILGDLHGHITLAYRLLKRWEKESKKRLDAIFQVGDFGAFPPPFKVDKATMRFYEKDPDELSFVDYYEGSDEADEILDENALSHRKIDATMYFIKGNHEDFSFLNDISNCEGDPTPVDVYNKIHYLNNGEIYIIQIGQHNFRVGCLGGLNLNGSCGNSPKSMHYTKSEFRKLCTDGKNLDLLLTHDAPMGGYYENAESIEILKFIEEFQPKLHFFGNYHENSEEINVPGITRSFQLNEVNFRKPSKLNKGCIAIVEISVDKILNVEILDEKWMKVYNRDNFRDL